MKRALLSALLTLLGIGLSVPGMADSVIVAVAANFAPTMEELAAAFERSTGNKVKIAVGSTGKHYAQIIHGAPFDIFFAADSERPALLEKQGIAVGSVRFTYALGQLVLWSQDEHLIDDRGAILEKLNFKRIAIANPALAPYGRAAQQTLESMGRLKSVQGRIVRGENVGQTLQFISSGAAELGFVALSQLIQMQLIGQHRQPPGSYWLVPQKLYQPIEQQVVLLSDNRAAAQLLDFVKSEAAQQIIRSYGYQIPG